MNAFLEKSEDIVADKSDEPALGNSPAVDPLAPSDVMGGDMPSGFTDRRLYRRSMAYFLFGYGCNQHSIVTDDPSD